MSYNSDWTYLFMILSNKAMGNIQIQPIQIRESLVKVGEFKHEVRQFEKSYDNQQAEQISLMV